MESVKKTYSRNLNKGKSWRDLTMTGGKGLNKMGRTGDR
jgi:hypothetical protein